MLDKSVSLNPTHIQGKQSLSYKKEKGIKKKQILRAFKDSQPKKKKNLKKFLIHSTNDKTLFWTELVK